MAGEFMAGVAYLLKSLDVRPEDHVWTGIQASQVLTIFGS